MCDRCVALWTSLLNSHKLHVHDTAHRIICKLLQFGEELTLRQHRIVQVLHAWTTLTANGL